MAVNGAMTHRQDGEEKRAMSGPGGDEQRLDYITNVPESTAIDVPVT